MYRTLLICAVISASILGCTTTSPRPAVQTASAAATQPCGLQTGSRIAPRPGECSVSPGRSYSQADIDRTGKVDVADALQLLDPSITVHH